MKILKLLIGKDFIGEKLGLHSNEFVITDIEESSDGFEFTIYNLH